MKKIILALALATMPVVTVTNVYATAAEEMREDEHSPYKNSRSDVYEISKITDKDIYLSFIENGKYQVRPKNINNDLKVEKNKFNVKDAKVGDQYRISYRVDDNYSFDHIGYIDDIEKLDEKKQLTIESRSVTLNNTQYNYTGYQSGIKRDVNDIDGKIEDEKLGELSYKKGTDSKTIDIKYGEKWYIFATEDYKFPLIPSGVYMAKYRITGEYDEEQGGLIAEFIETDENLFEPLDKNQKIGLGSMEPENIGSNNELLIWHTIENKEIDGKNVKSVGKIYWTGDFSWAFHDYRIAEIHDNYMVLTNVITAESGNTIPNYSKELGVKVGDYISILENGESLALEYENGKIYNNLQGYMDIKKTDSDRILAISTYQNLIKVNAANTLLEKTPQTVKAIQKDLKKTVDGSKNLLDESYKRMLKKDKLEQGDKDEAVVEMIRRIYYKDITTKEDKNLALAIYRNVVTTRAARKLLNDTPKTVESIKEDLYKNLEGSDELIYDSINKLK